MTALTHSESLLLALRQGDYSALYALADLLEEDGREDDSRLVRDVAAGDTRPFEHNQGASWQRGAVQIAPLFDKNTLPVSVWDRLRGGEEILGVTTSCDWRRYPSGHEAIVALIETLIH